MKPKNHMRMLAAFCAIACLSSVILLCGCVQNVNNELGVPQSHDAQQSLAATQDSGEDSSQKSEDVHEEEAAQSPQIDEEEEQTPICGGGEQYSVNMPGSYSNWVLDYNPDWYGYGSGQREQGCDMSVFDQAGRCVFHVTCFSDDFGPSGDLVAERIGPCAAREGFSVWISAANDDMTLQELEEYRSWVTIP